MAVPSILFHDVQSRGYEEHSKNFQSIFMCINLVCIMGTHFYKLWNFQNANYIQNLQLELKLELPLFQNSQQEIELSTFKNLQLPN